MHRICHYVVTNTAETDLSSILLLNPCRASDPHIPSPAQPPQCGNYMALVLQYQPQPHLADDSLPLKWSIDSPIPQHRGPAPALPWKEMELSGSGSVSNTGKGLLAKLEAGWRQLLGGLRSPVPGLRDWKG